MKAFSTFLCLVAAAACSAQTLTQSFNEPVIGDVDKNYRLDTSAFTSPMPLAQTGTNCVWDFTPLTGAFPVIVDSFIAPSSAMGATAYPNATFVQHRDPLYTFYRSSNGPDQTELLGATSPSLSLTFTNSAIIATYPVAYGYNLSDPVSGSFKYNTTNGACNGNITISVPGTGTISFAGGIKIPDVLCLRSVEILTLSAGVFPFGTFNQTIYNFYMPGRKFPVLNINYTKYQMITGTPTITAYVYGSNSYFTVAGTGELSLLKAPPAYPNPFRDYFSAGDTTGQGAYRFFDPSGRLLLSTRSLTDPAIPALSAGVYFFAISTDAGWRYQKLVKE